MDPLIIVPARAGSRGIPEKNTRPLHGLSPLDRAISCAQTIPHAQIIVTTDCQVVGGSPSLLVHQRPPHLATETASMVDVVADVLHTVGGPPEQRVLLIQPTQPLRTPAHLQAALMMLARGAHSVASVVEVEPAAKLYYADFTSVTGGEVERRQLGTPTYACDGTVYGFRRAQFLANPGFHSFRRTRMLIIPPEDTCRLDTPFDWRLAELRLQQNAETPHDRT